MRVLQIVSLAFLWAGLTTAPCLSANYSWPVTLTQQVSITNLVLPPSTFTLTCYVSSPNSPLPKAVGTVAIPVDQTAGGYSFSGPPFTVQVVPPGGINPATQPPHSGDIVSCGIHSSNSNQTIGSSTLTLP